MMRARWRVDSSLCRNTEAQRHSSEGSLSEMRECEMCKAVYESTSSNLTRYSRYMGCIYRQMRVWLKVSHGDAIWRDNESTWHTARDRKNVGGR